jgi:hypothetical protein
MIMRPIVDQLYDDVPTLKSTLVCLNSLRVVGAGSRVTVLTALKFFGFRKRFLKKLESMARMLVALMGTSLMARTCVAALCGARCLSAFAAPPPNIKILCYGGVHPTSTHSNTSMYIRMLTHRRHTHEHIH